MKVQVVGMGINDAVELEKTAARIVETLNSFREIEDPPHAFNFRIVTHDQHVEIKMDLLFPTTEGWEETFCHVLYRLPDGMSRQNLIDFLGYRLQQIFNKWEFAFKPEKYKADFTLSVPKDE